MKKNTIQQKVDGIHIDEKDIPVEVADDMFSLISEVKNNFSKYVDLFFSETEEEFEQKKQTILSKK